MIYDKNSFERYKEGKELSDKYTPIFTKCLILMIVTGLGGMIALESNGISGLWSIPAMLVPAFFGFRYSNLATKGNFMMKSAEKTYGSDEEEY